MIVEKISVLALHQMFVDELLELENNEASLENDKQLLATIPKWWLEKMNVKIPDILKPADKLDDVFFDDIENLL